MKNVYCGDRVMKRQFTDITTALVLALSLAAPAHAIVLTFEGIGNGNSVGNFYNTAPQDYDITFSSNALALVDSDVAGAMGGDFGGEPSPSTALYFTSGTGVTLNALSGFGTGFSLYYSAINTGGSFSIYEGSNLSGNQLVTLNLGTTPNNGAPDPTGAFSPFVPVGVLFSGTARSVGLMGAANQILFDDITLGSATLGSRAVPEPGTLVLLGGGLLLLGLFGLSQRAKAKKD